MGVGCLKVRWIIGRISMAFVAGGPSVVRFGVGEIELVSEEKLA